MQKFIIFSIILLLIPIVLSAIIYFWITVKRKWRFEDEAFNEKKRQEAIKDLEDSGRLLEEMRINYVEDEFFQGANRNHAEKR